MTINFSINFWQLLIIVAVGIFLFLFSKKIIQILLKIIFTSKPVLKWNQKRQLEQQKLIHKQRGLISYENLLLVGKVIDEIDKSLVNRHRKKQFWKDFALSKETRNYWIKTLLEQVKPKEEKLITPKSIKLGSELPKGQEKGQNP